MSSLTNNQINTRSMNGLVDITANSGTFDEIDCNTLTVALSATAPTVSALSNDTNVATTAWVTNHAGGGYMTLGTTQTASGEKTFSNANTFISGNLVTNNIVSALTTTDINIGSALTTGLLNIATLNARTGAININTGTISTAAVNISSGTNANASITIGSTLSTTQTATHNAITTFTQIPSCAVAPTSANHLCNYTYVNSLSASPLGGNNVWTGTNTFNNTVTINGQLTMGTANQILTNLQEGTTALTTVLLYSEVGRSGAINLGTGTTGKTITIGSSTSSTLNLRGSTIDANILNVSGALSSGASTLTSVITNTINGTAVGTGVNLYDEATRTGTINFGTGGSAKNLNIGGTNTSTTFSGTGFIVPVIQVNGLASFRGTTQLGDAAVDDIVPNGTLTKPWIVGYGTTSSFSLSSITPVTTYLGGTLQTTNSFSASATGTFRYVMASITPYDINGGLSLSAGTYTLWMGINFEDAATFNLTDLKMGLSTLSTLTSASSEAVIVASLPNLTCYFHKTDAGDAAISDSENRVLSSCFNLAAAAAVYPFYDANHSVTMDTVKVDVIITKIGSA